MKYVKSQDLLDRELLTYQEILNLKKRFNGYSKNRDIKYDEAVFKNEYKITAEHTKKGLEYLYRVTVKPSCLTELQTKWIETENNCELEWAMRKNSPLGYRELSILLNFDHFTFTGFYDATNMYQRDMGYYSLYPLWKTYDKDGDSFEYYIEGGEMTIIG